MSLLHAVIGLLLFRQGDLLFFVWTPSAFTYATIRQCAFCNKPGELYCSAIAAERIRGLRT